jgi:hypothetical protein
VLAAVAFLGCWAGLRFIAGMESSQALGWASAPFVVVMTIGGTWAGGARRASRAPHRREDAIWIRQFSDEAVREVKRNIDTVIEAFGRGEKEPGLEWDAYRSLVSNEYGQLDLPPEASRLHKSLCQQIESLRSTIRDMGGQLDLIHGTDGEAKFLSKARQELKSQCHTIIDTRRQLRNIVVPIIDSRSSNPARRILGPVLSGWRMLFTPRHPSDRRNHVSRQDHSPEWRVAPSRSDAEAERPERS